MGDGEQAVSLAPAPAGSGVARSTIGWTAVGLLVVNVATFCLAPDPAAPSGLVLWNYLDHPLALPLALAVAMLAWLFVLPARDRWSLGGWAAIAVVVAVGLWFALLVLTSFLGFASDTHEARSARLTSHGKQVRVMVTDDGMDTHWAVVVRDSGPLGRQKTVFNRQQQPALHLLNDQLTIDFEDGSTACVVSLTQPKEQIHTGCFGVPIGG